LPKVEWTYFNPKNKHRIVEEFCVWYLGGNATKVRIVDSVQTPPTDEDRRRDEIRRRESGGGFLRTLYRTKFVEVERFKNLKELVHKYSGLTVVPPQEKKAVQEELYGLIMQLLEDGRIEGNFRLQPYRDAELDRLTQRIDNLQARYESTLKMLEASIPNFGKRVSK
jgi:hypothetical protein